MQHEIEAQLPIPLQREPSERQRRNDVVVEREEHEEGDGQVEEGEAQHAVRDEEPPRHGRPLSLQAVQIEVAPRQGQRGHDDQGDDEGHGGAQAELKRRATDTERASPR